MPPGRALVPQGHGCDAWRVTEHSEVAVGQFTSARAAGAGAARRVDDLERRLVEKQAQLAGLQQEINRIERSLHRWRSGRDGERHVGALLDGLSAAGWVALHDLHWPGRPLANLDHVVVGPGGVVVIDAKNWAAAVAVRPDGVLSVGGSPRRTLTHETSTMVAAVAAVLRPEHRTSVVGALCFTGKALPAALTGDGVLVVGDEHLAEWLLSLRPRLAPTEVRDLADQLRRHLGGPVSPSLLTTAATSESSRRASAARATPKLALRPTRTRRPARRRASRRPAAGDLLRLGAVGVLLVGLSNASSCAPFLGALPVP